MSLWPRRIDERFWTHRLRSTSIAGLAGAIVAAALFGYRSYVDRLWSWDLLAVLITMAVVKMSLMIWYSLTD